MDDIKVSKRLKSNIAIFTNFTNLNPGYSLTGIVLDQCRMLLKECYTVYLVVNENFDNKDFPEFLLKEYPYSFRLLKKSKLIHLKDYQSKNDISDEHKKQSKEAGKTYALLIKEYEIDVVFTHDFIFTGWNLPYSLAVNHCCSIIKNNVRWLHWVHSIPSGRRDWWNNRKYGEDHFIVFPNATEINRVAESFSTNRKGVKIIPHIKDPRTWFDFSLESRYFVNSYPAILSADVVQVYPCSTDRLFAKRLDVVIKIFGNFKSMGFKVFLCAANQWATGRQRKDDLSKYVQLAEHCGLEYNKEFVFTSEYDKKYEQGISQRMVRELMLLSNLFVFPTREESFGLVGPEAALSGALIISNKSLNMMAEVLGDGSPSYDFGSFTNNLKFENEEEYLLAVTYGITNIFINNNSFVTKTFCRQRYNMDNLYLKYYLPSMY